MMALMISISLTLAAPVQMLASLSRPSPYALLLRCRAAPPAARPASPAVGQFTAEMMLKGGSDGTT